MIATSSTTSAAPASSSKSVYIVMTTADPLASYSGGTRGFERTRPQDGVKLDTRSANARAYTRHLIDEHNAALRSAGIASSAKKLDYTVAFNGFSAELTAAQATALGKSGSVAHVWQDEVRYGETISSPEFLGLTGSAGVWQQKFAGPAKAGAGMIIGVLDSGIWPENPSFAALPSPVVGQAQVNAKWHGTCDVGQTSPVACNNKLIGARYYAEGNTVESFEFRSPRDYNGHGSHTASTAGGDYNVDAVINGATVGKASGMAPAARLAAYKVLWATPDGRASGSTSGIVAAINDAVADGVDVINYSISGSRQYIVTPDELAFLGAANAGVFVSTSAGNEGDTFGPSSVAHNAPWTMTVAASTQDRGNTNTVTLGNGATYTGVGVSPTGAGPAPLIDSSAAAASGADPTQALLCYSSADGGNALDPAKVAGKIVVCTRGTTDRVHKSLAVQEAGGIGMILINTNSAQSLNADFHSVPTSHLNSVDGAAVQQYALTGVNPTATISPRNPAKVRAPEMAGFSSYGPAQAGNGDLLKPDITAPGVDIIAAVSPAGNGGNNFNAYSGTSMSAPHISGLAALMMQKWPGWSVGWIKSAMMTTTTDKDNQGLPIQRTGGNATPLDYGNGHVVPKKMFNPGLIYGNAAKDWLPYGCATGQFQLVTSPSFCAGLPVIDASDMNYPSISVGALAGSQTVSRWLTNAQVTASTYKGTVSVPGFRATIDRPTLSFGTRQSRQFKVTFTRTTAPLNQWAFGTLTWKDTKGHVVRSSIALKPVVAALPSEVTGNGASGSTTVSVMPGYTGTLNAAVMGLATADVQTVPTTKPLDTTATVVIPAGTQIARFATYDADYPAGTDVDLVVRKGSTVVGSSGGGTAQESVTLQGADLGGTYTVTMDYFAGTPDTLDIKLNSFAVAASPVGNMTATPASQAVVTGRQATVTLNWSGLPAGSRALGAVNWSDGTNALGRTLVSVLP